MVYIQYMKISGIPIADKILQELKQEIVKKQLQPHLAIIFAGNNPNSQTYIRFKEKAAARAAKEKFFTLMTWEI